MMHAEDEPPRVKRTERQVTVTPPTSWDRRGVRGLLEVIKEDIAVNGSLLTPGTQMLVHLRLGQWAAAPERSGASHAIVEVLYRLGYFYVRNVIGFEVPRTVSMGRKVKFVHQHGVTVHPLAQIGDECLVRHNVTIGLRGDPSDGTRQFPPPRIGRRVQFGVGTTVLGGVVIGDYAVLGAHAVVATDVPDGASVVAPPARVLRLRGRASEGDAASAAEGPITHA